ncbi:hypothetical protein P4U23_16315 [Aeribacillus composti]|uniref:hypothetical protein n=1 Tax=Aeribacillus composti TaxID=1868734 RepID=UPI002E1AD38C|nr:hypothetical protein [Aeribacillus composti]
MNKNITEYPNLKQIEQMVWRQLQETFSTVTKKLSEDMDQQIAEEHDKKGNSTKVWRTSVWTSESTAW